MSLALIQGYSSAEGEGEEEEAENDHLQLQNSSDDEGNGAVSDYASKPLFDLPKPSSRGGSSLPSAFDVFAEVSGPPEFLNNCVQEPPSTAGNVDGQRWRHGRRRNRKEKKDLPAGAVVESKAQLVGIHERVRSDIDGNTPPASSVQTNSSLSTAQRGNRVATAANPNAEDAAELLRMCLQCGIPKTYSTARGMVCPMCGDRPPVDTNNEPTKKKGSAMKEKEKSKRMKGQSSHATWKSETEMQLRQQFD